MRRVLAATVLVVDAACTGHGPVPTPSPPSPSPAKVDSVEVHRVGFAWAILFCDARMGRTILVPCAKLSAISEAIPARVPPPGFSNYEYVCHGWAVAITFDDGSAFHYPACGMPAPIAALRRAALDFARQTGAFEAAFEGRS